MRYLTPALVLALSFLGTSCTSSDDPPPPPPPAATYTVGGMLTGLTTPGLVLQLNGASNLTVNADGAFEFPVGLTSGTAYDVTVLNAPGGLICTVSAGDGVIGSANVTDVIVTCSANDFTVGGVATGILGFQLVLSLNGEPPLILTTDGPFTFPTSLADGSPFEVLNTSPPPAAVCTITNGAGTVAGANVTNVMADCVPSFTIGGRVIGGTGPLIVQLNGGQEIVVAAGASVPFTFTNRLVAGDTYDVQVTTPPTGQTCDVEGGSGTVTNQSVTGIEVFCAGTVVGLQASDNQVPSIYQGVNITNATTIPTSRNIGFADLRGLAFRVSDNVVFGVDGATDMLISINSGTGAATSIGAIGISDVTGLAYDDTAGVLYGISSAVASTTGQLITIDTQTGAGATVGASFSIGGSQCLSLAFDAAGGVLYAGTNDGNLFSVDPSTGGSSTSVSIGSVTTIDGLGFDQTGNQLFAVLGRQDVATINTATGMATSIGTVAGFSAVDGLTHAGGLNDLFGSDVALSGESVLLKIAPGDASARTVGSVGWALTGMAQDPASGFAYGITATNDLVEIDQNTGESRFIATVAIPGGAATQCLAYNQDTGTLFTFAIDPAGDDSFIEIDTSGAIVTDHGVTGTTFGGDWTGLCFATAGANRRMFGVHDPGAGGQFCQLYEVSTTGVAALQYPIDGLVEVSAIAYEQEGPANRFFVMDTANDRLVQVARIPGTVTVIGFTPKSFGVIWVQ